MVLGAGLALVSGLLAAERTTRAPIAAPALTGTWVNGKATSGIVRVVIRKVTGTGITVDTFSRCAGGRLCEAGRVPAVLYGPAADSTAGTTFQTHQVLPTSTRVLIGTVTKVGGKRRLLLDWYDVAANGARRDSSGSRAFTRTGAAAATARAGTVATSYEPGKQAPVADTLLGVWNGVSTGAHALARLELTRAGDGSLLVHAYGACTPTPCDNGVAPAIAYAAPTGTRFLVPADYGFKRSLLAASISAGTLTVTTLSEFTDSSGRSNYAITERLRK
jgi:hypothetical protein